MLDRPSEPKDMFTTLKRDRTEPRPNRSSSLWVHRAGRQRCRSDAPGSRAGKFRAVRTLTRARRVRGCPSDTCSRDRCLGLSELCDRVWANAPRILTPRNFRLRLASAREQVAVWSTPLPPGASVIPRSSPPNCGLDALAGDRPDEAEGEPLRSAAVGGGPPQFGKPAAARHVRAGL